MGFEFEALNFNLRITVAIHHFETFLQRSERISLLGMGIKLRLFLRDDRLREVQASV